MLNIIPFMFPQFPVPTDLSDIKATDTLENEGEISSDQLVRLWVFICIHMFIKQIDNSFLIVRNVPMFFIFTLQISVIFPII